MIKPRHQLRTSAARSVTPNMRSLDAQPPQASSLYARNAIRSLCRKMTATGCCTTGQTPDLNTLQYRSTRAAGSGGMSDYVLRSNDLQKLRDLTSSKPLP